MVEVLVASGLAINAGILAWVGKEIYAVRIMIVGYEHRLLACEGRLGAIETTILKRIMKKR